VANGITSAVHGIVNDVDIWAGSGNFTVTFNAFIEEFTVIHFNTPFAAAPTCVISPYGYPGYVPVLIVMDVNPYEAVIYRLDSAANYRHYPFSFICVQ
jgi:hypothetical protein